MKNPTLPVRGKRGGKLECVTKMRDVQFRVDWAAYQGDFPQACWRQVKGNQRRNAGKDAVTALQAF